jgi:hypothetical protein
VLTTDGQVRKLMEELSKHGRVGLAAMRAGVDRKTARTYAKAGKLPSELVARRTWRTRLDPFADDWPALAARLDAEPGLEAKTLFELLAPPQLGRHSGDAVARLATLARSVPLAGSSLESRLACCRNLMVDGAPHAQRRWLSESGPNRAEVEGSNRGRASQWVSAVSAATHGLMDDR